MGGGVNIFPSLMLTLGVGMYGVVRWSTATPDVCQKRISMGYNGYNMLEIETIAMARTTFCPYTVNLRVLEMVKRGDRVLHMRRYGPFCPEDHSADAVYRDVSRALRALHAEGLVHGDLALANLVCDTVTRNIVLCDYGMVVASAARYVGVPQPYLGTRYRLNLRPPHAEHEDDYRVDERTDMFSLCALVHQFLCKPKALKEFTGMSWQRWSIIAARKHWGLVRTGRRPLTYQSGIINDAMIAVFDRHIRSLLPGSNPEPIEMEPITWGPITLPEGEPYKYDLLFTWSLKIACILGRSEGRQFTIALWEQAVRMGALLIRDDRMYTPIHMWQTAVCGALLVASTLYHNVEVDADFISRQTIRCVSLLAVRQAGVDVAMVVGASDLRLGLDASVTLEVALDRTLYAGHDNRVYIRAMEEVEEKRKY